MKEKSAIQHERTFGAIIGLTRGLQSASLYYEKGSDPLALYPTTSYFTTLPEDIQIVTERMSISDLVKGLLDTSEEKTLANNKIQSNAALNRIMVTSPSELVTEKELLFLAKFGTEQFQLSITDLNTKQEWVFATSRFIDSKHQAPIIVPENNRLINPRVLRNIFNNAQNSYRQSQTGQGYSSPSSMAAKSK